MSVSTRILPMVVVIGMMVWLPATARAQTADELRARIDSSNAEIQKLKNEINKLQVELNNTSKQKQTLQNAVKELDLSIQKLTKSISLTKAEIAEKDEEIHALTGDISHTSGKIGDSREQVADSIRQLSERDEESVAVMLLAGKTLSSFFDEAAALSTIRQHLQDHIHELSELKTDLETDKSAAEDKRKELAGLQQKLAEQKKGLTIARAEQNTLLTETKNKESTYQSLIAQKRAQEAVFEQNLRDYESQLNLIVRPGSLPKTGAVLRWPVDQPFVTQYFGNTPFATANAQVYGGKGHNAIDLRAPIGTPIKAARGGKILGAGNTDLTCPNASYGKWVFIEHDNGLSTLYAHLSLVSVGEGQSVAAGQVIGYSGTTGYATGPHLHFGVYASTGAKIIDFPSKSCIGRIYHMPVADPTAYLNPLSYLPAI